MNCGMTVIWPGTISVTRRSTKRMLRNGKRTTAKMKPAIEQVSNWPKVEMAAMVKLFSSCRWIGMISSSRG